MSVPEVAPRTRLIERMARCRRAVLLGGLGGVPLLFLYNFTYDPFNLPKLALLAAVTAIAASLRLVEIALGSDRAPSGRLTRPALALAVPLTIAWAWSPYRSWAILGHYGRYQGLIPYLLVIAFGILLADAFHDRPAHLAWTVALSAGIAGIYSGLQAANLDPLVRELHGTPFPGVFQTRSTFVNPNFAGAFFALVLPVVLGLVFHEQRRRAEAIVLLALAGTGCVTAYSQGAWAAALGGLVVVVALLVGRVRPWVAVAGLITATLLGALLIGLVVLTAVRPDPPAPNWDSQGERAWAWGAALEMARDSPVIGRGPNTFAVEGVAHRPRAEAERIPQIIADDPHSVPLAILAGAGALGLAGWLYMVGWGIKSGYSGRWLITPLRAGFAGGVMAYAIQALVSFDEISTRLLLWTCLAGLTASAARTSDAHRRNFGPRLRRIAFVGAGVVSLSGIAWGVSLVAADHQLNNGENLALLRDDVGAASSFKTALRLHDNSEYRLVYGTRIGQLAVIAGPTARAYIQDMKGAFDYLKVVPDLRGFVAEARLLHSWGTTADPSTLQEALGLYRRARAIDRYNVFLAVQEAVVLRDLDRRNEARTLLGSFVESDPVFAEFWGALALIDAELGYTVEARAAIEKAHALEPNDTRAAEAEALLRRRG